MIQVDEGVTEAFYLTVVSLIPTIKTNIKTKLDIVSSIKAYSGEPFKSVFKYEICLLNSVYSADDDIIR
jgi:hypothetical protein